MAEKPKQVVKEFLSGFGLNVEEHTQFVENIGIMPFYCIVVAKKI